MTLSPRQREIADLTSQGMTEREIGVHLGIALQTVKNHKQIIFTKLGARDAMEMVRILYDGTVAA